METLECIDALRASWRTGLTELFQNEECSEILHQLSCLTATQDFCSDPEAAAKYDLDTLMNNCAILVYLGVRFE